MIDIMVTMPKSRGGLKHLQEKIDMIQGIPDGKNGYAWWWITNAKELTSESNVYIVCEGKIRGHFTIKWLATFDNSINELTVINSQGKYIFSTHEHGGVNIHQVLDGERPSFILAHDDFNGNDVQMLWEEVDDWNRNGLQTIFFESWYPSLRQPDTKGFQGFRYVRQIEMLGD